MLPFLIIAVVIFVVYTTKKAAEKKLLEAADKAVADKVISDKAAADKVISDKAAADKAVADKVISDKAAADKAVADKAAADKAVADKVISDKAVNAIILNSGISNSVEAGNAYADFGTHSRYTDTEFSNCYNDYTPVPNGDYISLYNEDTPCYTDPTCYGFNLRKINGIWETCSSRTPEINHGANVNAGGGWHSANIKSSMM
jgi:hypothetical protein